MAAKKPKNIKLTDEQKARFGPMLWRTWTAIYPDANCKNLGEIIELVCDATMPVYHGGMSREEYGILIDAYHHRDTQKWLREVLGR